jgi:hypothetical protein
MPLGRYFWIFSIFSGWFASGSSGKCYVLTAFIAEFAVGGFFLRFDRQSEWIAAVF